MEFNQIKNWSSHFNNILFICAFNIVEPFDGTNTARAVHEKQKFDMIKDQFLKVNNASD